MSKISLEEKYPERGVQRRCKVVRRIQPTKPVEERASPAIGVRARKSKTKREKQKTQSRDNDRGNHTPRKNPEFLIRPANKWRSDKEKIDRQVGKYEQRNERNGAFPLKIEHADVCALRRDPVATAVNNQEK